MGEMVTCRDTGKQIPIEEAYTKSSKNAKKKVWYSSKEGYDWWNEWNRKCIDLLMDLCFDKGMKFPSIGAKMLIDNGNIECTYMAMELAVDDIRTAMQTKDFYNEYGMLKYIFVIINKYYNDAVRIENARERDAKKEDYIPEDATNFVPVRKSKNKAVGGFLL